MSSLLIKIMFRKLLFSSVLLLIILLNNNHNIAQNDIVKDCIDEIQATFVAYNSLYRLSPPSSPSQLFVAEASLSNENEPTLVKLMYFPKPSSTYDNVKYLKIERNDYIKSVNMLIRPPTPKESEQCGHYGNFSYKGSKKIEPLLTFASFRYDSYMTFNFDKMKCYVLVSIKQKE